MIVMASRGGDLDGTPAVVIPALLTRDRRINGTGMVRVVAVVVLLFSPWFVWADGLRNIFDARVPMRDGVELSADIWLPAVQKKYPAILIRTPYVKAAGRLVAFPRKFAEWGYAVLLQDVRGRGDSDGAFLGGSEGNDGEGNDGYDTIEWIARQPWSNGDVCMMGLSYLGAVQWAAARQSPPHLKCFAPTATGAQFGVMYIGNAFSMDMMQWMNYTSGRMDQRAVGATLNWDRIYAHRPLATMDQAMGRSIPLLARILTPSDSDYDPVVGRRLGPEDFRNIDLPALHVTGWFDSAQTSTLDLWHGMAAHSPASDRQYLLIGPWNHPQTFLGGATSAGELEFSDDSVVDVMALHANFYAHYLKGEAAGFDFPRARVYVTGANRWRDFDAYPPSQNKARRLYLGSGGKANTAQGDGVLGWDTPGGAPADNFIYDPKNPVPAALNNQQSAGDQREIEQRQDVLVYSSEVLEVPLEIIGQVLVELFAATDGRDTDFTAKLVDVYADGRAVKLGQIKSGVVRARYRNGFDNEELLTPGKVEKYRISLADIGHTFLAGHRVRVEISSSAYPQVNPNQNTGNPIATDTEWRVAKQTIYHDQDHPSALILPVFSAGEG